MTSQKTPTETSTEIIGDVFTQLSRILEMILEDSRKTREILIATRGSGHSGATNRLDLATQERVAQWERMNRIEADMTQVVVSVATLNRQVMEIRDYVTPWYVRVKRKWTMWREHNGR